MSEETANKERKVFLGVLVVMAFLINGYFYSKRQSNPDFGSVPARLTGGRSSHDEQMAANDQAGEHNRFVAKYVNPGFVRKPGVKTMAMVVSSERERLNRATEAALTAHFKPASVELLPSFFTPEFTTDGLFGQAFVDAGPISQKLELSKSLDLLLLVDYEVQYTTNESLNNVITADIELNVALVKIGSTEPNQVWRYTAKGAGFSIVDSRGMAEERLLKQFIIEPSATSTH